MISNDRSTLTNFTRNFYAGGCKLIFDDQRNGTEYNNDNKKAVMLDEREATYRSEDARNFLNFMIITPYILSFYVFMDLDFVSVHNNAKRQLGQYPAIFTSRLVNSIYVLSYKIFDSYARDEYGRSHPQGTRALLEVPSIPDLIKYFQAIHSLGDNYEHRGLQISTYEITAVNSVREQCNCTCKQCCAVDGFMQCATQQQSLVVIGNRKHYVA